MSGGSLRFYTADVFTDRIFGGNQLAVFPDPGELDTATMQAIARELNLSETVFVFPPKDPGHTRRLRIFTPGTELPFAGHPTVGTAFVLATLGEVPAATAKVVFEEGVGPVAVTIRWEAGRPTYCELTAAQLPEFGPPPPALEEIAAVLSLRPDEISTDRLVPRAVSCGVRFLYIPLRDEASLARARTDLSVWERSFSNYWAPQLYPIVQQPDTAGGRVRSRMFSPAFGIPEDPATGSAAAALAGYLAATIPPGNGTLRWVVDQGIEMGRPSRLHVECDRTGDRVRAVRVGGASVMVAEARMIAPAGGRPF